MKKIPADHTFYTFRNKKLGLSGQIRRKNVWIMFSLLFLLFALLVASASIGAVSLEPFRVLKVFFGAGTAKDTLIVNQLRMPRAAASILIGAALGVSGAMMQGMGRNPLASPDILGITSGASAAAVGFLVLFESASIHLLPFASFGGALLTAALIYAAAWKRGVGPLTFVLVGVGIGFVMSALTTLLIVTSPMYLTSKALNWLAGSVYGTTWAQVGALTPWFLIFFVLALLFTRRLNAQQMGDDAAQSVGSAVQKDRLLLLLIIVALAGSAVAVGGAIGFVALIAPHIARRLVGPSFGSLLPVSALTGAAVVTASDLAARTAFSPLDLPVGLITSAVGAPFFIYLLYKNRNS
ncbi:FecCD family ABC transporter permease [Paenibacillus gansuensis]|uniref:FecCD family ABC transporter permease n=1 Tax=Paenibacillus gansuensis TaxID=306542 RepID=A0ABW5P9G9_9BACL